MKNSVTNGMMKADIRKAKMDIFNPLAIEKLKTNLSGAWKPNTGLNPQSILQLCEIGLEKLTQLEQDLVSHRKLTTEQLEIEAELKSIQAQEDARKMEETQLLTSANFLLHLAPLAQITTFLKEAMESKNHQQIKELLHQAHEELKTFSLQTEEEAELFNLLLKELHPLLLKLKAGCNKSDLLSDVQAILQQIKQLHAPQKWRFAA